MGVPLSILQWTTEPLRLPNGFLSGVPALMLRIFGDVTPFQRAFQTKNPRILSLLFPKATKDLSSKEASDWRFLLPGSLDRNIMMTDGESATLKIVSIEELKKYVGDRSYSLASSISKLLAKEGDNISMATDTPPGKRIL
jgi:hypothetical protein